MSLRILSAQIFAVLLSAGSLHAQNVPEPQPTEHPTLPQHATQTLDNAREALGRFWNQQVFTTEDKIYDASGQLVSTHRQGITVGKLVLGFLALLMGFFVSKGISRTVMGNVGRRFSVDAARGEVLGKLLFFFLLTIVFLTVLNWLQIPLTAFAFLGGALAIGVGFGAQTLMNNFISGVILLAEQRIKVGDLIEADGHLGRVMSLGMRCSRVRKGNGVDVLVPNSYLLEKNVVNWTLSDPHHLFDFAVGVAYGSSTEETLRLLKEAMEAESRVEKSPPAQVFFEEFGDNALIFRLYYWLDVRTSDNREIGSNIRLRIDQLCRDAGIEIAFPQRDVHLSAAKPIAVRIERETTGS